MRKQQKEQVENFIAILAEAHEQVKKLVEQKDVMQMSALLLDCQEGAIALGTLIEKTEGEGFCTIPFLEEYCELLYQVGEKVAAGERITASDVYGTLNEQLDRIRKSVREDITVRKEVVFFPYKASMWDSLESIWRAADGDPLCDAYVVPIPFFDKNPDGSVKENHYEGNLFPSDVPILNYKEYDLEERHPDVAYIHNPYDDYNYVTSVEPTYYSRNIKKYADILVYVPYFATAGGMADSQASCPAYVYADYIVVQSEKYIDFYDKNLPREKFLPFGSPKFDKVIRLCDNPPEAPEDWKESMEGRKVYFYNTSLSGMLDNTEAFLKKMAYVFDTFEGRKDACLLWRPHPLLESTFESLRPRYKDAFLALKNRFLQEKIGIYDSTPSIEETIALSDVYIGDAGTSVTSLFGVAGKPMFIFDNHIDSLPTEQDQKDSICPWPQFDIYENEKYQVTPNNQLWVSENNDHRYRFYMNLDETHGGGNYYACAIEIGERIYVLPANAQDLLMIQNKQIVERIEFRDKIPQAGAFSGYYYNEDYIFLFPFRYPSLVRYDLHSGKVTYVEKVGEFRSAFVNGEWYIGGGTFYGEELVIASPTEKKLLFVHMQTLQVRQVELRTKDACGTLTVIPYGDELWLLPLDGMTVTRWNPKTGEVQEYNQLPEGFTCKHFPQEYLCEERPFGMVMVVRNEKESKTVLAPYWGNMFVELDVQTGEMKEWKPKKELMYRGVNGYHLTGVMGSSIYHDPPRMDGIYRFWYAAQRSLQEIDIRTGEMKDLVLEFDLDDAKARVPGFSSDSEWLQYGCMESAFNSLKDLLDDTITGNAFEKEKALQAYYQVNTSIHGECGERVHAFICDVSENREEKP